MVGWCRWDLFLVFHVFWALFTFWLPVGASGLYRGARGLHTVGDRPFILLLDFTHFPTRNFSCNCTTSVHRTRFRVWLGCFRVWPAELFNFHIIRVLPGSTSPPRGNSGLRSSTGIQFVTAFTVVIKRLMCKVGAALCTQPTLDPARRRLAAPMEAGMMPAVCMNLIPAVHRQL